MNTLGWMLSPLLLAAAVGRLAPGTAPTRTERPAVVETTPAVDTEEDVEEMGCG